MGKMKRNKTKYPGVFFIDGTGAGGRQEKIYYILYRKNGKLIEEPVGRQFQDDMTPSRAAQIRTIKIDGHDLPNKEKRIEKESEQNTLDFLFEFYRSNCKAAGALAPFCVCFGTTPA